MIKTEKLGSKEWFAMKLCQISILKYKTIKEIKFRECKELKFLAIELICDSNFSYLIQIESGIAPVIKLGRSETDGLSVTSPQPEPPKETLKLF